MFHGSDPHQDSNTRLKGVFRLRVPLWIWMCKLIQEHFFQDSKAKFKWSKNSDLVNSESLTTVLALWVCWQHIWVPYSFSNWCYIWACPHLLLAPTMEFFAPASLQTWPVDKGAWLENLWDSFGRIPFWASSGKLFFRLFFIQVPTLDGGWK